MMRGALFRVWLEEKIQEEDAGREVVGWDEGWTRWRADGIDDKSLSLSLDGFEVLEHGGVNCRPTRALLAEVGGCMEGRCGSRLLWIMMVSAPAAVFGRGRQPSQPEILGKGLRVVGLCKEGTESYNVFFETTGMIGSLLACAAPTFSLQTQGESEQHPFGDWGVELMDEGNAYSWWSIRVAGRYHSQASRTYSVCCDGNKNDGLSIFNQDGNNELPMVIFLQCEVLY